MSTGEPAVGSSEFLLGKDLQRHLVENLECVGPGFRLYEEDISEIHNLAGAATDA